MWKRWIKDEFTQAAFDTVDAPLIAAGLDPEDFHIRMFFTRGAGRYIRSKSSRASPLGLLRWMLRMEQGRLIDEFSSLELKRTLYLTRKRIRYAVAPVLNDCAVFFKTGSLYSCKPKKGYKCPPYAGNKVNVLNAIVEVETPPPPPSEPPKTDEAETKQTDAEGETAAPTPTPYTPHVYIVAVMSNELKRNAAADHSRLAHEIHRLIVGKPGVLAP